MGDFAMRGIGVKIILSGFILTACGPVEIGSMSAPTEGNAILADARSAMSTSRGGYNVTSQVALLSFANAPLSQDKTVCGTLTIKTLDASGKEVAPDDSVTLLLRSTSPDGRFYDDITCANPISSVQLDTSTVNVYYQDDIVGGPSLTVAESPRQGWVAAIQKETINKAATTRLAFTNISLTQGPETCGKVTVAVQNIGTETKTLSEMLSVQLHTDSASGAFYLDEGCNQQIDEAQIQPSGVSATVYYQDMLAGQPVLTAKEMPSQGWNQGSQKETIRAGDNAKIVFTGAPFIRAVGVCGAMKVQVQDVHGNASPVMSDVVVSLSTTAKTSQTTGFFADNRCITEPISNTVIQKDKTGTKTFFYVDSNLNTNPLLTANVTNPKPGQTWTTTSQEVNVRINPVGQLVFTNTALAQNGYTCGPITVSVKDLNGKMMDLKATATIDLVTDSIGGKFYFGGCDSTPLKQVRILSNTSSTRALYYKDVPVPPEQGERIVTLTATESSGTQNWSPAEQKATIIPAIISTLVFSPVYLVQKANSCGALMMQTKDKNKGHAAVTEDTTIDLSTPSATGKFYQSRTSDGICTTPINKIIMKAGTDTSDRFYYMDSAEGYYEATAKENPSRGWIDIAVPMTIIVIR